MPSRYDLIGTDPPEMVRVFLEVWLNERNQFIMSVADKIGWSRRRKKSFIIEGKRCTYCLYVGDFCHDLEDFSRADAKRLAILFHTGKYVHHHVDLRD